MASVADMFVHLLAVECLRTCARARTHTHTHILHTNAHWCTRVLVRTRYGTEDERHAAEASVEDTNARLENLTFDFTF
jgi:uncharacterized RmlC-like cupin family protein